MSQETVLAVQSSHHPSSTVHPDEDRPARLRIRSNGREYAQLKVAQIMVDNVADFDLGLCPKRHWSRWMVPALGIPGNLVVGLNVLEMSIMK
jgi:hypothetical protein